MSSQAPAPQLDPILVDARDISDAEQGAFGREWAKAVLAGDFAAAQKISKTGLDEEHYLATLRLLAHLADVLNLPNLRPTPAQLDTLSALRVQAKQARDRSGYGL